MRWHPPRHLSDAHCFAVGTKARQGAAAAVLAGMRRASLQASEDASCQDGQIMAASPPQDAVNVAVMSSSNLAQKVPHLSLLQRWQVRW